jgi:hypothetical protein
MTYQAKAAMLYADAALIFKTIIGIDVGNLLPDAINKARINWLKTQFNNGKYDNETKVKLVNAAYDVLKLGRSAHDGFNYQHNYNRPRPEPPKPPPVGDLYVFWAWKGTFSGGMSESDISRDFSVLFHKFEQLTPAAVRGMVAEFELKNHLRPNVTREMFAGKIGTNILYRVVGNKKFLNPPYKEFKVDNIEVHPTNLIIQMHGLAAAY